VLKAKALIITFKEPFKTPVKSLKKAVIIKEVKEVIIIIPNLIKSELININLIRLKTYK
jgi:hypothetical protein